EPVADFEAEPELRAAWERTALARAVALAVLRYRTDRGLSQRALAAKLGMKQPHIARLELGERNPSIETLERLASVLGLRFVVDVAPSSRSAEMAPPPGLTVVGDVTTAGGGRGLVPAASGRPRTRAAPRQAARWGHRGCSPAARPERRRAGRPPPRAAPRT